MDRPLLHPLNSRVNNEAEVKNKMIAELGKFALKNGLEKFEIPKKIHLDAGKKFIPFIVLAFLIELNSNGCNSKTTSFILTFRIRVESRLWSGDSCLQDPSAERLREVRRRNRCHVRLSLPTFTPQPQIHLALNATFYYKLSMPQLTHPKTLTSQLSSR